MSTSSGRTRTPPTPGDAAALPATVDLTVFANTLNGRGQNGYAYRGLMQFGAATQALFVRDSSRPGPFSYRLLEAAGTQAALSGQLAAQAAEGYRYIGPLQLGVSRVLYQREQGDAYPVGGKVRATVLQGGDSALVQALNGEAANGYFYLGDLVLTDAGAAMTMVSVFSAGTQPAHPLSGPVWP